MSKLFVLDTCVLIHDPSAIFNFGEHTVGIPLDVIKELDRLKTEASPRGVAARVAQRNLLTHLPDSGNATKPLPHGGQITALVPPPAMFASSPVIALLGDGPADHRIIATAQWAKQAKQPAILVSKDMGMKIKAQMCDVKTEDYKHDQSHTEEAVTPEIPITEHEIARFASEGMLELADHQIPEGLKQNSYGLFVANKRTPWRYTGLGRFVKVHSGNIQVPNGILLKPRNLEQVFLFDALLNPNIHLVTASGPAGTGKTLVTMAAALQMIGTREYTGVCISKVIEPVGRQNGFLPGSIQEKMRPWLQPYADALTFLHTHTGQGKRQSNRKDKPPGPVKQPYDALTESGIVEITALEHIRGRSIPNRLLIVDEVQNVPPPVIKTITSRIAEGSKVIYLGDPEQIDNPFLDRYSNGLAYVRSRMGDLANAAHVQLRKGERSLLAQQAANLL